jgi:proteasome lid subunit RPN8/RPN11
MKEATMRESESVYRNTSGQESPLKVLMPEAVWQKMMGYVNACDYEINGFGYVERLDESTAQVEDVFILKQAVNAGSAVTEPDEIASHISQMIAQGKDTSALRFQWHSHVHMQAYFSGTDTGTIDAYTNCDWMISLVANKREEFAIRLDVYQPFRFTIPAKLKVFSPTNDEIARACAQEVKEKVSVRTYGRPPAFWRHSPKSAWSGWSGWGDGTKRDLALWKNNEGEEGATHDNLDGLWRPARDIRPV